MAAIASRRQLIAEMVGKLEPAQVQRAFVKSGVVEEAVDALEPTVELLGGSGHRPSKVREEQVALLEESADQ